MIVGSVAQIAFLLSESTMAQIALSGGVHWLFQADILPDEMQKTALVTSISSKLCSIPKSNNTTSKVKTGLDPGLFNTLP